MSAVDAIDLPALRERLEHSIRLDLDHEGSLYLRTLAACYLAVDENSPEEEASLFKLLEAQAKAEGIEGDEVCLALCLLVSKPAPRAGEP